MNQKTGEAQMSREEMLNQLILLGAEFHAICTGDLGDDIEESGERVMEKCKPLVIALRDGGFTFEDYVSFLKEKAKEKERTWDYQTDIYSQQLLPLWRGWDLRDPDVMDKFMALGYKEQDEVLGVHKQY